MRPATSFPSPAAKRLQRTSRVFDVAFTPDPVRVGHMRRITRAFLRQWNVHGPLTENVVLVVSELVTNAVEHGKGDGRLRVRHRDEEVRIEVTDSSPTPARMRPAGHDDESGRGLFLVAELAWTWGVSNDGTTTWAILRAPEGRS
ncbi:ATP-binding protein [Streptomyces scopuliridis]|uniref:ATP-binding protein n=1 Tax=Streptomyces scopuliridis TaxID=452529 RepID=UPI0036A6D9AC